ncbi:MAG: aspartate aminotransferase family protein [Candidatus Endonucleobacter bathymodioli]|uniref:Acetylornithine aminotransferase n=1 Tax=Candidatus Endonucleibacter bathymodioli TaxID=539814 RepID=A0AA90NSY6_9GAMM|nr:aspartate aminotransferase family protein [Candidatus Endonucleobacter bathymodioli]
MVEYLVSRASYDEVMTPNYAPQAMVPVRGKGSRLWDQQGKEYIDFAGGIAVNALGHCHSELVKVLKEQSDKLWHLSNAYTNEPALSLARKLIDFSFADKVFFCNSGTEANEAALKLARKYAHDHFDSEKHEIISFSGSFHGRSLFTVSVGGQTKYQEGFAPLPGGITHLPFNDVDALKKHMSEKTCAVILEPIQGEGGVHTATQEFMEAVRAQCDKYNALMVLDEVQTGVGRTGKIFAYMDSNITPDILTSAKALGCGFPIGAMLAVNKVAASLSLASHGSTYGGNPLACAVALAVLNLIDDDQLLANVSRKHNLFRKHLETINKKYNVFSDIRGKGLLVGAVLNENWKGRGKDFRNEAGEAGVMLLLAGQDILRMTPSLIITDEDINEGMERLDKAIAVVLR